MTLSRSFPHQIFDLLTNFQRKFDNGHCNDVEKQSKFTKFDCLKADLSAFVETFSVSTFHNHYNPCSKFGRLAQLVEHPLDVRAVEGSSPPASTKNKSTSSEVLLFLCLCPKGHNIVLRQNRKHHLTFRSTSFLA